MPTLEQIREALRRADAAGNTNDARPLASAYAQMRSTEQANWALRYNHIGRIK